MTLEWLPVLWLRQASRQAALLTSILERATRELNHQAAKHLIAVTNENTATDHDEAWQGLVEIVKTPVPLAGQPWINFLLIFLNSLTLTFFNSLTLTCTENVRRHKNPKEVSFTCNMLKAIRGKRRAGCTSVSPHTHPPHTTLHLH